MFHFHLQHLRKWMNETGIPASQRDQLPLLAAGSEVLWVCGAQDKTSIQRSYSSIIRLIF